VVLKSLSKTISCRLEVGYLPCEEILYGLCFEKKGGLWVWRHEVVDGKLYVCHVDAVVAVYVAVGAVGTIVAW